MSLSHKEHEKIIHAKLGDSQMRENLSKAMHTLQNNRKNVINAKFYDWEGLRRKAKRAKNNAIYRLGERLEEFEKNATKNGIKVHWASSAEDACEIIYLLMKERGATKILKGKSMASEEIGLNHYLQHKGVVATETDLGELILQLDDEPPVHIVVPAIHKNRYQVGETFKNKLGAPLEHDIEKLNQIARKHLREQFEELSVGLSGVNFAMSREGAFWLIENEGNGRMCTTSPDIHIAICGIEKVMETFEDAATTVALTTPSATGQFIPTYNNIITGPRGKNNELDGPKEVHIVLFDNHRTKMAAHEDFSEALRCIRCGCCMNFCPVYDKVGGHSYVGEIGRTIYPGPIGEVIGPNLFGIDKMSDILTLCSLCGRCSEVCPVMIPLADLIRKLRSHKVAQGTPPQINGAQNIQPNASESFVFKRFASFATSGKLWRFGIGNAHLFNSVVHTMGGAIPVVKNWVKFKDLPQLKFNLYKEIQKIEGVIYE